MSNLIKWSGSKSSQAKNIISFFPKEFKVYYEPFAGGGSIFMELLQSDIKIERYIISDVNKELIEVYLTIKENPYYLIHTYKKHYDNFNSGDIQYRKDYFDKVRNEFNISKKPEDFYWIMRTTTNGMPRYNKKGEFNNSCHFSRPGMNPTEVENNVMKWSQIFFEKSVEFYNISYELLSSGFLVDNEIRQDDLIYCDPPYENTKGMYFGNFNNQDFIKWLNTIKSKWILSYDGKVNEDKVNHIAPNYKRHEYLISGNSSFRRVIGNSNDSIISESLYLNF